jgi:transcriptional regulator with XRE-family HTH domain
MRTVDMRCVSAFGDSVQKSRLRLGMTLDQVGAATGSVKGYISTIENSKCAPPLPKIVDLLAQSLGLNAERMHLLAWLAKAPEQIRRIPEYDRLVRKALRMPMQEEMRG